MPLDAIAERAKKYQPKPKITYKMIQEYVEKKYGFKVHTAYIAEKISELYQEAYDVYLPLVEDVCSRKVSEEELSHLLDYLLDFACDVKVLGLYKRVCRRYLYIYPNCVNFYIEAYREMWKDENDCLIEFS